MRKVRESLDIFEACCKSREGKVEARITSMNSFAHQGDPSGFYDM